jgi:tripartite-type tricarboxylate transporter receptor subunit TctC
VPVRFRTIAISFAAAFALVLAVARPVSAQGQPVVLVVPFAAGGPTDLIGRMLAREMGPLLGRQMIVENVAGAGGTVGSARVAKAAPDGQMILLGNIGHATAPYLNPRLPYRAVEDFEPVGLVVDVPMTLVGRPNLPASTIPELRTWLSANRGKVTIAHAGVGASSQLCALLVMRALGENLNQVAYGGTGPALNDVIGRHVDLLCDQATTTGAQIRDNKVKAFGVTSAARVENLPNVPTLRESGLAEAEFAVWHGLYLPAGTPPEIVERVSTALREALKMESVSVRLMELGATPARPEATTPAALRSHLAAELARWQVVLEAAGVKP